MSDADNLMLLSDEENRKEYPDSNERLMEKWRASGFLDNLKPLSTEERIQRRGIENARSYIAEFNAMMMDNSSGTADISNPEENYMDRQPLVDPETGKINLNEIDRQRYNIQPLQDEYFLSRPREGNGLPSGYNSYRGLVEDIFVPVEPTWSTSKTILSAAMICGVIYFIIYLIMLTSQ